MEQDNNVQTTAEVKTDAKETKAEQKAEKAVEEKKYTDTEMNAISLKNSEKATKQLLKELGIDDVEKATVQSVDIIINYNKKNLLRNALKNEELSTLDKLNQINEVLSNKGKGGENDSE